MKKIDRKFIVLCAFMTIFLGSCGDVTEEDVAAIASLLEDLELDDCYETEEEGYVAEDENETDEISE